MFLNLLMNMIDVLIRFIHEIVLNLKVIILGLIRSEQKILSALLQINAIRSIILQYIYI